MTKVQQQLTAWGAGIDYEIEFWSRFFATKGLSWPDDYRARLDPSAPMDPFYVRHIAHADLASVRILDVGSGPVSKLEKIHQGMRLNITACDSLADHYAEILGAHGVTPPIRTIKAFAEDLACYFDRNGFDLVTCTNALDHSFEPLRGIVQMLEVVKVGGTVLMEHNFREAENENYSRFHQWNFDLQDGRFIIWNRSDRIDVAEHLASFAEVAVEDRGYVTVAIKKTGPVVSSEFTNTRDRVRVLLDAAMAIAQSGDGAAIRMAEARAVAAEARAEAAEARCRTLLESTSWRALAPVRSLVRLARG